MNDDDKAQLAALAGRATPPKPTRETFEVGNDMPRFETVKDALRYAAIIEKYPDATVTIVVEYVTAAPDGDG